MRRRTVQFVAFVAALLISSSAFAQTTIISEDFEGLALPTDWMLTQNTPSVGFEFGATASLPSSQYFAVPTTNATGIALSNDDAYDNQAATQNVANADRLITPELDLSGNAAVLMSFDYYQPGTWGSEGSVEVSTDGGTTWASVLTVTQDAAWTSATLSLGQYVGQSSVWVAFRHNDGDGWADGFAVDNVVIYEPAPYDVAVSRVAIGPNDPFLEANAAVSLMVDFQNLGSADVTELEASYTINGGTPVTETITGLNVTAGASSSFTFPTTVDMSMVAEYDVEVTVTAVNGNTDSDALNNDVSAMFTSLSSIPVKNGILEDHTGAWCQFCPDGTVRMEAVLDAYPNTAIGVAVHNGDAMAIPEGGDIQNAYIGGYPSGIVDHYKFPSQDDVELNRGDWMDMMGERLGMIVPVSVSITDQTYDTTTRNLTVTVQADFVGPLSGDLRFNVYVIEDSVTGSGSGYDQVNYYNTQSNHPYTGAGNPIVGFVHNHTLRAALGGAWGTQGMLPTSVNDGDSYFHVFNYTLPANFDETQIKLVGMVRRFSNDAQDRQIYNAEEVHLDIPTSSTSIDPELLPSVTNVYPNPMTDRTSIEFDLKSNSDVRVSVYDLYGKEVAVLANGMMNVGGHSVVWNARTNAGAPVANGIYIIRIDANGLTAQQKVSVNR